MRHAWIAALTLVLFTVHRTEAADPPAAVPATSTVNTNDPVELELRAIMKEDDAAQEDIERMVTEAEAPRDAVLASPPVTLSARIRQRGAPVRERYDRFLRDHPKHARARLAYGSFLNDLGEEEEAIEQWEKSRSLDPSEPAAWNNLANVYAHLGPVAKSFPYYEEALRLKPDEPVYLHNFGTLVFMFRKDATNFFKCDEQTVFNKAFELYRKAIALDPQNFQLAADVAQTYYGWRLPADGTPAENQEAELKLQDTALRAWTNALAIAPSDAEREGVQLHFARWNLRGGHFDFARTNLASITNEVHQVVRNRLLKNVTERETEASNAAKSPKSN
jgi:tetratricopeptide (TPR) repeat protein